MVGLLCEVCHDAMCAYERRAGILECNKCHADIKAGRRPDPLRKDTKPQKPRRVA